MKPTALVLSGWGPYKGVERADFEAMQRGLFLISGPTGAERPRYLTELPLLLRESAEASGRRTACGAILRTLPHPRM